MRQAEIDQVYADLAKHEKEIYDHNEAIINAIGKTAMKHFNAIMDGSTVTEKIEIVNEPRGTNQNESYGPFKAVWVDQRTGYICDNYYGHIYAKFGPDKWLKIPYEC